MSQRLRTFVSSPTDVPDERLRADLIVDKLSQDYSRFFTIESYRWEHEAMLASKHFQDAIEPPSAFDIVVLILWSRLGTPLPEKTAEREYRGIDGRAPVTGTEWEYEEALKVAREKGAPDLLAFRNISPSTIDPRDPDAQARSIAQLSALNAFWTKHFRDKGVFLGAYDEYRTLEEFAQRLEESLRKLIERRIKDASSGAARSAPIWLGEPFRGLESYEFEHAPIFFGRDAAVMKATEQLAAKARSGHAFLLVSGASGSGKSSLAKAGIVSRLMKPQRISGAAFLRRTVFRPAAESANVFLGLATALTRTAGPDIGLPELIAPGQHAAQLATHLRGAVGEPGYLFGNALGRLTEAERSSGRLLAFEEAKLILVVDQFEELFTVSSISPEDRRLFVQLLAGLARSGAVWVIVTLRADFWHRAAEIPELIALAEGNGRIDLAAASPAELAEMIRKPAQAAGLAFEVHAQTGLGLDAVLAQDAAAAPGALPLLSFALDELYKNAKARGESVLTYASYEALGGLEGAIANRADEVVAGLPAAAQAALPRVLRALATVSATNDQKPVGRSVPLETFAEGSAARILVDAFVAARLLVAGGESRAASTVRLAHEALISRWQRARDQLAADRRDLETRTLVEREFARWNQARGYSRYLLLLRNPDLANAVDLAKRWGDELDAPTHDFIKRSTWRRNILTGSLAAGLVLALGLAGLAYWQRGIAVEQESIAKEQRRLAEEQRGAAEEQRRLAEEQRRAAEEQRDIAERRRIGSLAELATSERLRGNLDTALRLGVHAARLAFALKEGGAQVASSGAALAAAVWQSDWRLILGHTDAVLFATFSPDGKRIITTSSPGPTNHETGTATIWDAQTGRKIAVLRDHLGAIKSAAFSPDETRIVTASMDETAGIWDAASGRRITVLRGHEGFVNSAVFSPDGRRIVTASNDQTARIWDAATGTQLDVLRGHEGFVRSAVFSPDGRRIVTASNDQTRIWDAGTKKEIAVLRSFAVTSAGFSPDGKRVVTASFDRTARIWDAASGNEVAVLRGHETTVEAASFSPDGKRIVTASGDKTARIWDAGTGQAIAVLRGHQAGIESAAFSPEGTRIVTASWDKTARIWDASGNEIAALPEKGSVSSAMFSPDDTRIVTASADKAARIWDTGTNKEIVVLRGHEEKVDYAGFSPDGKRIVTASRDKTARIWDGTTGNEIVVLRGHQGEVKSAAFSYDGTRVVTASTDKTARIWDAAAGKEITVLRGHEAFVRSAVFSPDDTRILTASEDKTARIWDVATGKQMGVLQGESMVTSAGFSRDGNRIITGSYQSARIWDAGTRREIDTLRGHEGFVNSAVFSPNGERIVTAAGYSTEADNAVQIWDAATGKQIAVLRGYNREEPVWSAAFNSDGTRLITGSNWMFTAIKGKTARIWDVHFTRMPARELLVEVCTRRLLGLTKLTRDEMRLAGYPDDTPEIEACAAD